MYDYTREERINEERIGRLVSWYFGRIQGPVQVDAELHKRCNLRCSFCPRSGSRIDLNEESRKKELSKEKWISIVRELSELGALIFNIEGAGEPLAVPELLLPVMQEVKNRGMYGIITTNGTLWDEEKLKILVDIDWDRIHFSIDAPDAKIHDELRGINGAFKKTIKSIKLLNEWKEKLNSPRPMLNMNIVINKKNYFKLPQMVEFANKLNVNYIFTEPLMVFSEEGKKLKLNEKERKKLPSYVEKARLLTEKYGIDSNFTTNDRNLSEELVEMTSEMEHVLLDDVKKINNGIISAPCLKPWDIIAIKYDGLTGHCGLIQTGEYVTKKTIKDIWFGKFLNDVRKRMIEKKLLDHCSRCIPSDITQRRRFRKKLIEEINKVSAWTK